jgi:hypothetical protein
LDKKFILGIIVLTITIGFCFPQNTVASTQSEESCKDEGGRISNFGQAYELEYLDYCLDLSPEICNEIKGVWKDCIPPVCNDLSKPCPTVLCIGYDVCQLYEQKDSFIAFSRI